MSFGQEPAPTGVYEPKWIAQQKSMIAAGTLDPEEVGNAVVVAVDTLNGFVQRDGSVVYMSKPNPFVGKSVWDMVQDNFSLLNPNPTEHATLQLEVAHAICDVTDISRAHVASTIHKAYMSPEAVVWLQSDRGMGAYREAMGKYKNIQPQYISAGIAWPILFHLGLVDQINSVSTADPVAFARESGVLLTHAISFDTCVMESLISHHKISV
jgi:hypothetical protein